jgi:mxaL protein
MVDVTQSMNVADMTLDGQPVSRLAYARQALRASLLQLPCGSRIGLGLFTEYRSFLLLTPVEVCANLQELRSTLDRIDGRMAWIGGSEVAKGLISGIGIAGQLPGKPSLVFVTDGHEAPPLNPRHRPRFDGKPGEVPGLVLGVGGLLPMPIPKSDPTGRPLGFWAADEVMQSDPQSRGRGASVSGEAMAEDGAAAPVPEALRGGRAGGEHLSSLREGYLKLLAGELGLSYLRLDDVDGLVRALTAKPLARPVPARADLRVPLALMALLLLAWRHAPASPWRRLKRG